MSQLLYRIADVLNMNLHEQPSGLITGDSVKLLGSYKLAAKLTVIRGECSSTNDNAYVLVRMVGKMYLYVKVFFDPTLATVAWLVSADKLGFYPSSSNFPSLEKDIDLSRTEATLSKGVVAKYRLGKTSWARTWGATSEVV